MRRRSSRIFSSPVYGYRIWGCGQVNGLFVSDRFICGWSRVNWGQDFVLISVDRCDLVTTGTRLWSGAKPSAGLASAPRCPTTRWAGKSVQSLGTTVAGAGDGCPLHGLVDDGAGETPARSMPMSVRACHGPQIVAAAPGRS